MSEPIIDPSQYNNTCYIVGGGTSLMNFNWALLNDPKKFVIVINCAYMKLPNAQVLYCTDQPWIQDHLEDLEHFKGIKYQGVLPQDATKKFDIIDKRWILTGFDGIETKAGSLRHGSNSSYAALNMATVHLGFKRVYLLGLDMKWGKRGAKNTSHWHSGIRPHKRIDGEAVYVKMQKAYASIKQPLIDMGVEVINVNTPTGTDLKTFPIQSVAEAFAPKSTKKEPIIGPHVLTLT